MQVAEFEEENGSLFERLSELEDELGAAQAQSHAHVQSLSAMQAELMVSVCSIQPESLIAVATHVMLWPDPQLNDLLHDPTLKKAHAYLAKAQNTFRAHVMMKMHPAGAEEPAGGNQCNSGRPRCARGG